MKRFVKQIMEELNLALIYCKVGKMWIELGFWEKGFDAFDRARMILEFDHNTN